ncbi:hypothetical protein [Pseudoxanthomonas jiangsuensis]|uniref:hypothetical protein n=1 Tax=Pseudoxanthomonas jiangsuensis TaxID=619688 RepID=UPI001390B110|nr:hypothetical protein [Pseudoxanthomonas jiangsuensis]
MRLAKLGVRMFKYMVLCGFLVVGFVLVLDPWPRYLGRVHGEVVKVEGGGRFSGPSTNIQVRLKEGAIIPVTIADADVKKGDVVVLLAYESRIFTRRSYDVSMEGLARNTVDGAPRK